MTSENRNAVGGVPRVSRIRPRGAACSKPGAATSSMSGAVCGVGVCMKPGHAALTIGCPAARIVLPWNGSRPADPPWMHGTAGMHGLAAKPSMLAMPTDRGSSTVLRGSFEMWQQRLNKRCSRREG